MWDPGRKTENVWLSIADLPHSLHAVVTDSKEYVSDLAAESMRVIPRGTLLVSFKLTLGRLAYAGRDLFSNEAIASLLEIDEQRISKEFLYWALTAFDWDKAAEGDQKVKGKTLNKAKLKKIPIPFPALEEQRRIVAVLDEAFEGLARARAHAEANLKNSRELFSASLRSLFSDNSEHWPLRNIADVCSNFGRGKSKHRPRNDPRLYGGDMPFIQTGDLSRADHFLSDFTQTYSPAGIAQSRVWPKGTVCVAIVGATIGESAILEFEACFPDSIIGMIPHPEKADPEFLEFLLQFVKADLKEAGKGSARDNINLRTFSDRLFPIPNLELQFSAVEKISSLNKASRELAGLYSEKLHDIDDLRQCLLQRAFAAELA